MRSALAEAIGLDTNPVAILESDTLPENPLQFKEGKFGCVAAFLKSAFKGRSAAFTRSTFGCPGGGVGLGFGDCYQGFPGGIEQFLSTGNPEFCRTRFGQTMLNAMPDLEEGERYFRNPEAVKEFVERLPMRETEKGFILFRPLPQVTENEVPKVVVFLVNPDQLSALVIMANYAGKGPERVIMPFAAACQNIGIIPFREADSEHPRAVVGLTDVTVRSMFPRDALTFAVPWKLFREMESNVEGSFLQKRHWQHLLERSRQPVE